ncbi:DNA methyltransferase [Bosea sp. AS-1]|uniref:DNA methyltransferase n=1 Tax=Bosea sp. AS-1 TaxID=2015316 RepID=UPI000B780126|nr:DNA methyltransferase [Bosea sp. AS-1]
MRSEHLDGRVVLHGGDSREVLKGLADCSIDSVVTDPPYALVSIVKRFGGENAAPANDNDVYARSSAGFMGKQWDTGETAFAVEFWAEIMRVLKPGGHVVAFSGTRTYHRLAVAIEDAGFEIRDQLAWAYGSGFPKSHDVSKGIDKKANETPLFASIRSHIRAWRDERGMTNKDLNAAVGSATNGCGMARHWTSENGNQHSIPSKEQWRNLKAVLGWPDCDLDAVYDTVKDGAERPVVRSQSGTLLAVAPGQDNDRSATTLAITAPATDAARQWQGWGTALKPAWEPIVLARKPLTGTVAANVLEYKTGALNIDGCRVGDEARTNPSAGSNDIYGQFKGAENSGRVATGRWPANIVHDGSDEVVRCFPEAGGGFGKRGGNPDSTSYGFAEGTMQTVGFGDSGSAARFFYSAKADKQDRIGSKHPTVKPVDLMQWLCRLVTPPGGTVLDPFAGSGSTGEAAWREGFQCVLIEREPEYQADIAERLRLADKGPLERRQRAIKQTADIGGLFANDNTKDANIAA